eukprot:scaffold7539_cov19-Tisochrysis_lutea.AAC.1
MACEFRHRQAPFSFRAYAGAQHTDLVMKTESLMVLNLTNNMLQVIKLFHHHVACHMGMAETRRF